MIGGHILASDHCNWNTSRCTERKSYSLSFDSDGAVSVSIKSGSVSACCVVEVLCNLSSKPGGGRNDISKAGNCNPKSL